MGSRDGYRQMETGEDEIAALGPMEIAFIAERDSLYQGTVGESGWPYVQHRGGPPGFLKVLDERTLGYADFSGNRQYLSVGNMAGDDRVSLFLMDYAQQRRLKIWGRARLVDESLEPELIARLESPGYRARVERGVVIHIEAYDWNCPKYITPRYTKAQVDELLQSVSRQTQPAPPAAPIGNGNLALTVTGIRQMTPRIRAYELRASDWGNLPVAAPGAHLSIPVQLADGTLVTRQYSLATHPARRDMYEIAVLREDDGRGGSAAIHASWAIGTRLDLDPPLNQFALHDDARPAVLIAGGIGITPIKAMAQALQARGTPFMLHYTGRRPEEMAYRDRLAIEFPQQLRLYFSRVAGQARMDIDAILRNAAEDAVFYVCGPAALIGAVATSAGKLGLAPERVQFESFT
jgi:ferredoxin-NADP reductase/predicted pyridoxine 5'-phosphate oxidase superfamily flavin-nucleotide-binding protein